MPGNGKCVGATPPASRGRLLPNDKAVSRNQDVWVKACADQIVVEVDQILSEIGLISNAGGRYKAPETISAPGAI
jgi:hypothetical protein